MNFANNMLFSGCASLALEMMLSSAAHASDGVVVGASKSASSSPQAAQIDAKEGNPVMSIEGVAIDEAEPEIVVSARRADTEVKIDRTIYDVQIGTDGASLNVTDILRKLPSVFVSASNRISIRRGANVGFLIDGKSVRSNIALAIPASQIERVEIITNPSGEFASDSDALINLILKQGADYGLSGTASGKFDSLGGYRAGLDIAHGGDIWKLNAAVSASDLPQRTRVSRSVKYTNPAERFDEQLTSINGRNNFRQYAAQGKIKGELSDTVNVSLTAGANYNLYPQFSEVTEQFFAGSSVLTESYTKQASFNGFYPYANASFESAIKDKRRFTVDFNIYAGRSHEENQYLGSLSAFTDDRLNYSFLGSGPNNDLPNVTGL